MNLIDYIGLLLRVVEPRDPNKGGVCNGGTSSWLTALGSFLGMLRRVAAKSEVRRPQRGATLDTTVLGECSKPKRGRFQFTVEEDASNLF